MKNSFVLIIYILTHFCVHGQNLHLNHSSKNNSEQATLDSLLNKPKFSNFKSLKQFNDSSITQLQNLGYLNLLIKPLQKTNDTTYTQYLELKRRYRIIKITTSTSNQTIDSLVKNTLSRKHNKNHITINQLESKLKSIQNSLSNNGYPFTKITSKDFKFNKSDTVQLNIKIDVNQIRRIDNIQIKGYNKFPVSYIRNITRKKPLLNEENIKKIKQQLEQLPFIDIIKEPEILFKKDSTILYVYINKKENNLVDGLIGFNNNDEKLEINGYLDLTLNNNLNNGEKLHLIYRGDDQDQIQLDIDIEFPYLLKSNIGATAGINILRRDSTYQNSKFNAGLFYSFNPQTNIGISYNNTISNVTTPNPINTSFNQNSIQAILKHEKSSNDELFFLNQSAQIEIGLGNRNTDTEETSQLKINSYFKKNIEINQNNFVSIEGYLKLLESDNILFNELFQVGGINSIRGFNQNGIDTSFFTSINTEYRYRLNQRIYVHSILDYGIFEDFNSSKTENIYGLGIGTAILTQSGILRISIANGTFSGANFDFSSTVAHINLQIRF